MENRLDGAKIILKGIAISFAITLILFYILGIILSTTSMPEKIIDPAILIITGVSILIATSIVTIKANDKGMIRGGIIGLIYFLLLYMLSSILLNNFEINIISLIMFAVAFACGGIGGIVGVNIKR